MQVSSTVQVGRSRAGSAHTNGRVPRHEDNGNSCGCCIDLTRDDSEGSDVEMLEADDVAITRLSLDDVAPASTPLRDPYAVGFSHAGNASSSYGARASNDESANALQGVHRPVPDWQCAVCTLKNVAAAVQCAACGASAHDSTLSAAPGRHETSAALGCPGALTSSPPVQSVGQHRQRVSQWACSICTLSNVGDSDHCTACDSWRFSRTLPTAL